jgi:hypothetical protein
MVSLFDIVDIKVVPLAGNCGAGRFAMQNQFKGGEDSERNEFVVFKEGADTHFIPEPA